MTDELRPMAGAATYHDLPLLKPPVWTWEVPAYFFVGGAAGVCALLAFSAQLSGSNPAVVRDARRFAAAGAVISGPLLVSDLGRPERFLNMLRIFKPQSPMSVGAWTVAVFGGATAVTVLADARGWRGTAAVTGAASAATGLVMATYTGVLLGATAIPVWAAHAAFLPVHFGASALGAGAALLELRGHQDAAINSLAIGAAVFETAAHLSLEEPAITEPLVARLASALSGAVPLALRVLGGDSRRSRQAAAISSLLGSFLTRVTWVEAGRQSARDPRAAMRARGSSPH